MDGIANQPAGKVLPINSQPRLAKKTDAYSIAAAPQRQLQAQLFSMELFPHIKNAVD
jgi:hypothetical protein